MFDETKSQESYIFKQETLKCLTSVQWQTISSEESLKAM